MGALRALPELTRLIGVRRALTFVLRFAQHDRYEHVEYVRGVDALIVCKHCYAAACIRRPRVFDPQPRVFWSDCPAYTYLREAMGQQEVRPWPPPDVREEGPYR